MRRTILTPLCAAWLISLSACAAHETATPSPPRERKVLPDAVKVFPEDDDHPPFLHVEGWEQPQPLPGPVNTAGGEDTSFITADGSALFFFFTPDVSLPAEEQLADGVTGIYQSQRNNGAWSTPKRVILNDDIALDGCPFVHKTTLWFCSVRPGFQEPTWFTAQLQNGKWTNWQSVNFDSDYQVGELHITEDGEELFFHSARPGSKGLNDIWISHRSEEGWGKPENMTTVNTSDNESRPFLTADGEELYYTRSYQGAPAMYRSQRRLGGWTKPELILSQFAGEPTLDPQGNIYFVHHFFKEGEMIEVYIYVSDKK